MVIGSSTTQTRMFKAWRGALDAPPPWQRPPVARRQLANSPRQPKSPITPHALALSGSAIGLDGEQLLEALLGAHRLDQLRFLVAPADHEPDDQRESQRGTFHGLSPKAKDAQLSTLPASTVQGVKAEHPPGEGTPRPSVAERIRRVASQVTSAFGTNLTTPKTAT